MVGYFSVVWSNFKTKHKFNKKMTDIKKIRPEKENPGQASLRHRGRLEASRWGMCLLCRFDVVKVQPSISSSS